MSKDKNTLKIVVAHTGSTVLRATWYGVCGKYWVILSDFPLLNANGVPPKRRPQLYLT